jgi:hypothetical protein
VTDLLSVFSHLYSCLSRQDAGPSGPYRSFSLASYQHTQHLRSDHIRSSATLCEVPDCAISTPTYQLGHSYKETLMKKQRHGSSSSSAATRHPLTNTTNKSRSHDGVACVCSPDTLFHTLPLLVALDSLGGVTCSRLTLSPTPVSCSAKVAASHISGVSSPLLVSLPLAHLKQAPRTLALSRCGSFLALGSSTSLVQIFSLKVKDSPDSRFSVNLTLLTGIVIPFPLDYLFFTASVASLKGNQQNRLTSLSQYELLSSSKTGNIW